MVKKDNRKIILAVCLALAAFLSAAAIRYLDIVGIAILLAGFAVGLLALATYLKPALGPIWIMIALPLERIPTLDIGAITIKPIHGVILAVFIAWVLLFVTKRTKLSLPTPVWIASLFWLVGLWSLSVSIDPERTVLIILFWLVALLGFWLVIQFIQTKDDLKEVVVVTIVASAVLGVFSLYQLAGDMAGLPYEITGIKEGYDKSTFGITRIHATLAEPLYFGNYLLVPFFLSVCVFLYGGVGKISKNIAFIVSLGLLVCIVLTISRGAYLGLGVGALLLIVWQRKRFFRRDNFIIIASTLGLSLVLVSSFFMLSDSRATEEITSHLTVEKLESESVVSRSTANERAYEAWQLNPVLGIGLGGYGMLELEDKYESYIEGYRPIVNNQYMETLAETGLIGFVLLILLIIIVLWRSFKAWKVASDDFLRATLAGLTLGFIGILAQYFTFSTIYIIYIWVFAGLLVVTQEIIFNSRKYKVATAERGHA